MLDIGWSEILLIAVVAIVVIGPKDLPDALRTLGRMMSQVRRMAGEFQGQFKQALREANLEDVKRDFDEIRQSTSALTGGLGAIETARTAITGPSAAATVAAMGATSADPKSSPPVETSDVPSAEEAAPAEPIPSAFATSPSFRHKS